MATDKWAGLRSNQYIKTEVKTTLLTTVRTFNKMIKACYDKYCTPTLYNIYHSML